MNDKVDLFFEKAEKQEYLKEKYSLIKNQENKNNSLFFAYSYDERKEVESKVKTSILNQIEKKEKGKQLAIVCFIDLALLFLFFVLFYLFYDTGSKFIKNTLCISFLSVLIVTSFATLWSVCEISSQNNMKTLKNYCLKIPKIKEQFLKYFYSPNRVADKKYIEVLIKENKNCISKLKRFDDILRKKKNITYNELNSIFGLTESESKIVAELYASIVSEETKNININNFSKETLSFLK